MDDYGYEWEWNNEKPLAFNNCCVILSSTVCAFHILRNRGFSEFEVSNPADARNMKKRHSLYALMEKLNISTERWITYEEIDTDEDELKQIDYYAQVIHNNLIRIENTIKEMSLPNKSL